MLEEIDAIERWSETEYLAMYLSHFHAWYDEFGIGRSLPRSGRLISRVAASVDIHIASELETEIEERILKSNRFAGRYRNVIDVFSDLSPNAGIDDGQPGDLPTQEPLRIWNALWVIRLTFTHGDGYVNRLRRSAQDLAVFAEEIFDAEILQDGFMLLPNSHAMDSHMARLRLTRALGSIEAWFDDRMQDTV